MKPLPTRSTLAPWSARNTPLGRLSLGGVLVHSGGTGFARFRDYAHYALVFVFDGAARYRDERGREATLGAGDVIAVQPGLRHQYGPLPGGHWSEAFVSFEGPAFERWVREGALTPERPTWFLGPPEIWLPRWMELISRRSETLRDAVELAGALHLLIADVTAAPAPVHHASTAERVRQSIGALEAWPPNLPVDWEALAARAGCAAETWRKGFTALTGEPPARYRRRVLMETAAGLLRRGDFTNEELAAHFGCVDAFHFSKMFKAVHGVHPREFRHRVRSTR